MKKNSLPPFLVMNIYCDSIKLSKQKDKYIVIDTNILSAIASDRDYYKTFFELFKNNPIFIDPIVKLEFLRGAYIEKTYKEKSNLLKLDKFYPMVDHQDIYKKVYDTAFNIARIYSHKGKPAVPLGDILITARLEVTRSSLILTEDINDFPTVLFDRLCMITFERTNKEGMEYLEHVQLLQFNQKKYDTCLANLPE